MSTRRKMLRKIDDINHPAAAYTQYKLHHFQFVLRNCFVIRMDIFADSTVR